MYVLDTNTLIYFFKGMGRVADRLQSVSPQQIGLPTIVVYELEYGMAKSNSPKKRRQQLDAFGELVQLLPFGASEAKITAHLRAKLESRGTPIGPHDLLIAGTTLAINGTLVTNNTKEFSRVPKLKLENWF